MNGELRCKVPLRFQEMFDKSLKSLMKSECGSRDFGTALQLMAVNPVEAECDMIKLACKGLGTKEDILYPIICGRSNKEMEILKKKFFELYTEDLGRVLDSELGGHFEQIVSWQTEIVFRFLLDSTFSRFTDFGFLSSTDCELFTGGRGGVRSGLPHRRQDGRGCCKAL